MRKKYLFLITVCILKSVQSISAMLPPNLVQGAKTRNIFLTQTDCINYITWTMPYSGQIPTSYRIYRDITLTDLVATVLATEPLQYYDHNRNAHTTYTYYIVSVDQKGNTSDANSVTITR